MAFGCLEYGGPSRTLVSSKAPRSGRVHSPYSTNDAQRSKRTKAPEYSSRSAAASASSSGAYTEEFSSYDDGNSNGHGNVNGNGNGSGAPAGNLLDPYMLTILQRVSQGQLAAEEAAIQLREVASGYQQVLDFASLDSWRAERTGFPEAIFGPGKSPEQLAAIMQRMAENDQVVMATRITPEVHQAVRRYMPDVHYHDRARILTLSSNGKRRKQPRLPGTVAVLSGGTADEGVAEECRVTADIMGCYCFKLTDVSVDGLHRILTNLQAVRAADVVVVISGNDGALPAVVAGLVEAPVIAVPTSVGYGASLSGIAPLLAALTASSPGVSVVNIDNGFGAAMIAARTLRLASRLRSIQQKTAIEG